MHRRIVPLVVAGALALSTLFALPTSWADPAPGATGTESTAPGDESSEAAVTRTTDSAEGTTDPAVTTTDAAGSTDTPADDEITTLAEGMMAISGTLAPVDALSVNPSLTICEDVSGSYSCYALNPVFDPATGAFTITESDMSLVSGVIYRIYASADGYLPTFLGGALYDGGWDFSGATPVTIPAAGGEVEVGTLTLIQGALITGTVAPAIPVADGLTYGYRGIQACEVSDYSNPENCISGSVAADGTFSVSARPGVEVVVYAYGTDYAGDGSHDGDTQYLTSWYGGGPSANSWIVPTTATRLTLSAGETIEANITLTKAATISGTIALPDGYDFVENYTIPDVSMMTVGSCQVDRTAANPSLGTCNTGVSYVGMDGSYTISNLLPGAEYVVFADGSADPDSLLNTAYGQWSGMSNPPWNFEDYAGITPVQTNADSSDKAGVDITMVAGSVVSGTVTPGIASYVSMCEVTPSSSGPLETVGCESQYVPVEMNGEYSFVVRPGAKLVVYATPETGGTTADYLQTYYGGYAGNSSPSASEPTVTQFDAPAAGTEKTGVDIAMVKAAVISGTVTLPTGATWASYAYARVCEVGDDGRGVDGICVSGSIDPATGAYSAKVAPGKNYYVYVAGYDTVPALMYSAHGGYASLSSEIGGWTFDTATPGISVVPTPAAGGPVPGIDITMKAPGHITGTIFAPDGSPLVPVVDASGNPDARVTCNALAADGTRDPDSGYLTEVGVAADGTYSCQTEPGSSYSIIVYAEGYPPAWVGGQLGETALPDPEVARVASPDYGATLTGQDIHLTQGSTISGKVTFTPAGAPSSYLTVQACQAMPDGGMGSCVWMSHDVGEGESVDSAGTLKDDGTYTLTGIIPGVTYVVNAYATGYVDTWYGQTAGYPRDLVNATGITKFTSAAAGGNVPNIDITLVKPVTVTGSLLPVGTTADVSGIVFACPTYVEGGEGYYPTWGGYGVGSYALMAATPTSSKGDVSEHCSAAYVASSDDPYYPGDGTYTFTDLIPGWEYVIIGQVDGYTDTWYGGYQGDSTIGDPWEGLGTPPDALIPTSDQITLVTGEAGETITGADLIFANGVTVTFDADGGTPAIQTVATAEGATVSLATEPTREGYIFSGWFTERAGAGTAFTASTTVNADITVYAKWVEDTSPVTTFTVTFDADGGLPATRLVTVEAGATLTVPEPPTKEGYVFAGWFTQKAGAGTEFTAATAVYANATVYAKWTPVTVVEPGDTFTVTYAANGGTGSVIDATEYESGATVTVAANAFTRAGYHFTGWNTLAAGTGTAVAAGSTFAIAGDITLYAQWAADSGTLPPPTPPVISTATPETIGGTAEPGATVTVIYPKADGTTGLVTTTVGADGKWSVPTPADAVSGKVQALVTNPDGTTASALIDLNMVKTPTGGVAESSTSGATLLLGCMLMLTGAVVIRLRRACKL